MVILLAGSTDLGRKTIAEKITRELAGWRHLSFEELQNMKVLKDIPQDEGYEEVVLRIACNCARELGEEGYHLVISMPHQKGILEVLEAELDNAYVPVHLGTGDELEDSDFPYVINTLQHSTNDVFAILTSAIAEQTKP